MLLSYRQLWRPQPADLPGHTLFGTLAAHMAIFLCMIMFVGGHILAAAETTVPDDGSLACYTNTFMPAVVLPSSKEYVNVSPPVVSTIYPPYHASGLYAADASAGATVCIRYQVLMNSTGWTEADAGTWPLVTDGESTPT